MIDGSVEQLLKQVRHGEEISTPRRNYNGDYDKKVTASGLWRQEAAKHGARLFEAAETLLVSAAARNPRAGRHDAIAWPFEQIRNGFRDDLHHATRGIRRQSVERVHREGGRY